MPLLRLHQLTKSFRGVCALGALSLELEAGEVLGLVGENGAGKSTLIKLLGGVHAPDAGEIWWLGEKRRWRSPRTAQALGISTLHQELAYCDRLTVAENLLLGEPWPRWPWGGVHWRRLHAEAASRLARFDLSLSTRATLGSLRAVERQEVAIARALAQRARLLILDEPTAALTGGEAARLLARLRRLREARVAIIYVSHRLDEVLALADRVAVLRDGELVALSAVAATNSRQLVRDMLGREAPPRPLEVVRNPLGPVVLETHELHCEGFSRGLSFRAHAGEVLGLAGLEGSGCRELMRSLSGLMPWRDGRVELGGMAFRPAGPEAARRAGIAYLPEERQRQALVPDHSVAETIAMGFARRISRWGWMAPATERQGVNSALADFSIRARHASQAVGSLSGGNQQKAVLARALVSDPDVLLLNEPTRGVDVNARGEIHQRIGDLARAGKCVLLTTSDVGELVELAHRVLVLHQGAVVAELVGAALTQENVLLASSGLTTFPATGAVAS